MGRKEKIVVTILPDYTWPIDELAEYCEEYGIKVGTCKSASAIKKNYSVEKILETIKESVEYNEKEELEVATRETETLGRERYEDEESQEMDEVYVPKHELGDFPEKEDVKPEPTYALYYLISLNPDERTYIEAPCAGRTTFIMPNKVYRVPYEGKEDFIEFCKQSPRISVQVVEEKAEVDPLVSAIRKAKLNR